MDVIFISETKVPKSVSLYFARLARRANAKMVRGSAAEARTLKGREARKRKAEERKATAGK